MQLISSMRGFNVFPALKHKQADHLRRAAAEGNIDWISRILSGRTPADPKRREHTSALQMACRNGHIEAVKALVAKGADVNRISPDGTALMEAAAFGHEAIVRFLIENKADAQLGVDGDLPMHRAARGGHAAIMRVLEQQPGGAEALQMRNAEGKTPLILACGAAEGGCEAVALLLERGADVAATDKNGNTALHMAAISGNAPVARLLLATPHGEALSRAANEQGRTPTHLAALFGHEGVARALVEGAPNMAAADKDGYTPLHLLCKSLMMGAAAQAEIACIMLGAGADPAAADAAGRTAGSYATSAALRQLLAGAAAGTSGGGAEPAGAAGVEAVVLVPALGLAAVKQGPSKKELVQGALQSGLAAAGAATTATSSDGGTEASGPSGTEAFLIKEALRKHTSEEPDGWRLGSEVAPQSPLSRGV